MQSDNDSLERLVEDVDKATNSYFYDCGYFGSRRGRGCSGCPAEDCDSSCMQAAFEDIARRLHALMPHDMDGREIRPGDTIEAAVGTQVQVTDVMALPAIVKDEGACVETFAMPWLWRVVQPDSWERLEEYATMLPHDYLTAKDTSDKRYGTEALTAMSAYLVLRAKIADKGEEA